MAESEVLKGCLAYLKFKNIYCWRNNTGAIQKGGRWIRFGYAGSSDILGICPDGRFLAVECKREKGGKVSELQKEFSQTINQFGGVAITVNSVEMLISELQKNNVIQ